MDPKMIREKAGELSSAAREWLGTAWAVEAMREGLFDIRLSQDPLSKEWSAWVLTKTGDPAPLPLKRTAGSKMEAIESLLRALNYYDCLGDKEPLPPGRP